MNSTLQAWLEGIGFVIVCGTVGGIVGSIPVYLWFRWRSRRFVRSWTEEATRLRGERRG